MVMKLVVVMVMIKVMKTAEVGVIVMVKRQK